MRNEICEERNVTWLPKRSTPGPLLSTTTQSAYGYTVDNFIHTHSIHDIFPGILLLVRKGMDTGLCIGDTKIRATLKSGRRYDTGDIKVNKDFPTFST